MFGSAENLRVAAEQRSLHKVMSPWREARTTWFDGTVESIDARLATTNRALTTAQNGFSTAHLEAIRELTAAREELIGARATSLDGDYARYVDKIAEAGSYGNYADFDDALLY